MAIIRLEHVDPAILKAWSRVANNAAYQTFWAMKYRETPADKWTHDPLERAVQQQLSSARSYAEASALFDEIERQGTQFPGDRPVEVLLELHWSRWHGDERERVSAWRREREAACPGHERQSTETIEQGRRGWHPAHCKHCGKDMSYDSGD